MMNVSVLERQPITWNTVEDFAASDWPDLAEESREILGYTELAKVQVKRQKCQALHETFAEFDIRPFTDASVRTYKEACESRPNRILADAVTFATSLSILAVVCGFPALLISALFVNPDVSFYIAITMLGCGGVLTITQWVADRRFVERKWVMHELASYGEPVPEFALQTALDIKKRHSNVTFFVDALEESNLVVDPFLVMRLHFDGAIHDFYVEVWNESKFTGEREA